MNIIWPIFSIKIIETYFWRKMYQIFKGFFESFILKISWTSIYVNYFILHIYMTDFTQEIKRLQKLSCIALSPEQEKKLWTQLIDIIWFLGQLPETEGKSWFKKDKLTLRTISGSTNVVDNKKILKNVKHGIVNNSIVIKSVLS